MRLQWIALVFVLTLTPAPLFSKTTEDPIDELNREMFFLKRVMTEITEERSKFEVEKKLELERQLASKKKREAAQQLAVQFHGLSRQLSQMPEIPHFSGQFRTQSTGTQEVHNTDLPTTRR